MVENIRTHLVLASQQRVSITGSIVNLHGFVLGANAVVWASLIVAFISVGGALPSYVFLGTVASALTVGLWRCYVQYLANQITHLYPEIILYECLSSPTERLNGVRAHLVWNYPVLRDIFNSNLTPEQQAQIVETLVEQRRIGNRGHWPFNLLAIIFILLLLAASVGSVVRISGPWEWYYTIAVLFILAGLALVIISWARGHRNPTPETVRGLIQRNLPAN